MTLTPLGNHKLANAHKQLTELHSKNNIYYTFLYLLSQVCRPNTEPTGLCRAHPFGQAESLNIHCTVEAFDHLRQIFVHFFNRLQVDWSAVLAAIISTCQIQKKITYHV